MKHTITLFALLLTTIFATTAAADPVEGPRRGAGVLEHLEVGAYDIMLRSDEVTIFKIQ